MSRNPVLGLNIGLHDSGAALLSFEAGRLVDLKVASSERLSRKKHQGLFPYTSLQSLRRNWPEIWARLTNDHVGINCFGTTPLLFEEIIREKIPAHDDLILGLDFRLASFQTNPNATFVTHHQAHAYSCLPGSGFSRALVLISDGAGNQARNFPPDHPETALLPATPSNELEYFSVYLFEDGQLRPLKKSWNRVIQTPENLKVADGVGAMFENAANIIFGNWSHAGKVMGLSAWGTPRKTESVRALNEELSRERLRGLTSKEAFDGISPEEFRELAGLAATVQLRFEETMISHLRDLRQEFGIEDLILGGGCALNCVLNDRILREKIFRRVHVPPWPNDEGIAIGCGLALAHKKGLWTPEPQDHVSAFLGGAVSSEEVPDLFSEYSMKKMDLGEVSDLLTKGEVVAWMSGRSEVGPRALGNRSIFARPDIPGVKDRINATIKFRESFRPYGVSVLEDRTGDFFEVSAGYASPYMTFAPKVRHEFREKLAEVSQPDGTCRIQTVSFEEVPHLAELLKRIGEKTSLPVLLHTSLNVMGEPICETLSDAVRFFRSCGIRYIVVGDYLVDKGSP